MNNYHFSTKCVRSGYTPNVGEPVVPPIVSSVTYRYETTEQVHELFDLERQGYFYSRIENPTVSVVEQRVADLEGGVGAIMTSSGQAANLLTILNIASSGDHIVAASSIYAGTINLFQHRLKNLGINVTFINNSATYEEVVSQIRPNTKAIFSETLSNPLLRMTDITQWSQAAHDNFLPLIIDNTFATPYFCNPIEYGADIVTHSSTKYLDGHALEVSGIIVDSGKFNWREAYQKTGAYAALVEPDVTYKNLSYVDHFKNMAFIVKCRVQLMRDLGSTPSPFSAFLLGNGLQTLHLRMQRHYENAVQVANYLQSVSAIRQINFPDFANDNEQHLVQKYLPRGCSGVLSFVVDGGSPDEDRKLAGRIINTFKLINIEVNVAEIRSCALHPATSTHRQMSNAELEATGIEVGLIRLSVGLEDVQDVINDIDNAFKTLELR